jgi:hypothetical protein
MGSGVGGLIIVWWVLACSECSSAGIFQAAFSFSDAVRPFAYPPLDLVFIRHD